MKELDQLQGTWQTVLLENDGRNRPLDEVKRTRVVIDGDHYTLRLRNHTFEGVICRIDPAGRPRAVDFVRPGRHGHPDERFLGIYLLEDDELTICVAPPGQQRPQTFDSPPGSHYWLHLLRRDN